MLLMKHLTHQTSDNSLWVSLFWFLLRNKAHFHCMKRVRGMVPVKFLPPVFTRNSCSGNVPLYRQSFRKERVVSEDLPRFLSSHFALQPVHVDSEAQSWFYGPMCTHSSALNSSASQNTEDGNHWIALWTANFSLLFSLCPTLRVKSTRPHSFILHRKIECTTRDEPLTSASPVCLSPLPEYKWLLIKVS